MTFISCFRGSLWSSDGVLKAKSDINYKLVVASLWMLVFATVNIVCNLQFVLYAFIYSGINPVVAFFDMSNPANLLLLVTVVAQTFMGDCILLYRCWVIYDRRWMVVICPIVMYIVETGCGIAAVYIETTISRGSVVINPKIFPLLATFQALTLATNIIATSLILIRIWTIRRALLELIPSVKNHLLSNAIYVLVESAFMYTASVIVMLIVYVLRSNATYIVSQAVVQIIGIAFNLIIIRLVNGTAAKSIQETLLSFRASPPDTVQTEELEQAASWKRDDFVSSTTQCNSEDNCQDV
ncbi:uncharacterized protein EV420DRAFT_1193375 [Desarmillaria tabescens]|uniref:Uncharacterized protein n=1 Tax=Armillaria tabescens TaxID=1929756 RepID=A0AA39TXP9_ARMTA|nr:uncharacterized protein EV420DRAFT_1193375 [Desarmillaria tabescens]KAK0462525.1 hypothetical protein EV420DRAFT_1193375 [Desarmillaria tabescens]